MAGRRLMIVLTDKEVETTVVGTASVCSRVVVIACADIDIVRSMVQVSTEVIADAVVVYTALVVWPGS